MLEKYAFFRKMCTFVVFFFQKFGGSEKFMYLCMLFLLFHEHFVMGSELSITINNYL